MDNETNLYNFFLNGYNPESDSLVRFALEDFRDRSGLSAEALEGAQIRIFSGNAVKLKGHLGFTSFNGQPILKTARLVEIPSFQADGSVTGYHFKLYPAIDGRRYLHAKGKAAKPYILPEVWAVRDKPNKCLWISEGAKKCLKLLQHGRPAIGLQGVWNFRCVDNEQETFLFDDLEKFLWKGRTVYLGFDMDLWHNPQVRFALFELALKLMSRGAVIRFPRGAQDKGIDDYLTKQKDPEEVLRVLEDKAFSFEKFILVGNNGKSVFINTTSNVVGENNTSNVSFNKLSNEYYVLDLYQKMINISGETPHGKQFNTDTLKQVVAGDWVTGRRPYMEPMKFRPYAKHYLGSIRDIFHYFSKRTEVRQFFTGINQEQPLLAHYTLRSKDLKAFLNEDKEKLSTLHSLHLMDNLAEYEERERLMGYINAIVHELHTRHPSIETFMPREFMDRVEPLEKRASYLAMATMLNALPASNKVYLGRKIETMLKDFHNSGKAGCFAFKRLLDKPVFVFGFFSGLSRTERILNLDQILPAALCQYNTTDGLAVAFDADDSTSGFDLLLLRNCKGFNERERRLGEFLFPDTRETSVADPFGRPRPYTPKQ